MELPSIDFQKSQNVLIRSSISKTDSCLLIAHPPIPYMFSGTQVYYTWKAAIHLNLLLTPSQPLCIDLLDDCTDQRKKQHIRYRRLDLDTLDTLETGKHQSVTATSSCPNSGFGNQLLRSITRRNTYSNPYGPSIGANAVPNSLT